MCITNFTELEIFLEISYQYFESLKFIWIMSCVHLKTIAFSSRSMLDQKGKLKHTHTHSLNYNCYLCEWFSRPLNCNLHKSCKSLTKSLEKAYLQFQKNNQAETKKAFILPSGFTTLIDKGLCIPIFLLFYVFFPLNQHHLCCIWMSSFPFEEIHEKKICNTLYCRIQLLHWPHLYRFLSLFRKCISGLASKSNFNHT